MKAVLVSSTVLLLQLHTFCDTARALTFPFTESFTSDAADWRGLLASQNVQHHASGGVDNGGFISIIPSNDPAASSFAGTFGALVFRANSINPVASSGAFSGNWIDAGVSRVHAYIRHNFTEADVEFYVRAVDHPNNSPAVAFFAAAPVAASDKWTLVNFEISPDNDTPAPGTYFTVLPDVGHMQIGARILGSTSTTSIHFEIDQVSIVPEPSVVLMALGTMPYFLPWRRRRIG
jgi:hypothetical protein